MDDLLKYETVFGHWHIKNKIGEGSYGTVYAIEREELGVVYTSALKIISIPKSQSDLEAVIEDGLDEEGAERYFEGILKEMMTEFALMAKLKGQSNIVSYEDHQIIKHDSEIGWDILIRMELLTPLKEYRKDNMKTEEEIIRFGVDICQAIELCSKNNVIHRDIKPENIFVSSIGNFKLGDFGIAKNVEKTTGAQTRVGTSSYMAPEVSRGEKYDSSVDIYSLGLVMYRFLNDNRLPFYPPFPEQISFRSKEEASIKRLKGDEIPNPSHGSSELIRIIKKAISYLPRDRYSSATEFKNDLNALLYSGKIISDSLRNTSEADDGFGKTLTNQVSGNIFPLKESETVSILDDDKTEKNIGFPHLIDMEDDDRTVSLLGHERKKMTNSYDYEDKDDTDCEDKTESIFAARREMKNDDIDVNNINKVDTSIKDKKIDESELPIPSVIIYCPKCGNKVIKNISFCLKCFKKIKPL